MRTGQMKNSGIVKTGIVIGLAVLFIGMAASAVEPDRTPSTECSGNNVLEADGTCITTDLSTVMGYGATASTNLDLGGTNSLHNLAGIYSDAGATSFFNSCSSGEAIRAINADGTVTCEPVPDTSTDNQNLSEVLVQGAVANTSIDMGGEQITNIGSSGTYFRSNGDLDFNGRQIHDTDDIRFNGGANEFSNIWLPNKAGAVLGVNLADGTDIMNWNSDLSVDIANGNLNMSNNRIIDIGSGGTNFASDGDLDMSGNVIYGLPNGVAFQTDGDLDLNGQTVRNIGSSGSYFHGSGRLILGERLNMSGNHIDDVDDIRFNGGSNSASGFILPDEPGAVLGVYNASGAGSRRIMSWKRDHSIFVNGTVDMNNNGINDIGSKSSFFASDGDLFVSEIAGGVNDAGGAGDPTYTFDGDQDTGLYRAGANQVALTTGGAQALSADASQNIRIPNGDLNITRSTTVNVAAVVRNTGTGDADSFFKAKSMDTGETGLHLYHDNIRYWAIASGDLHNKHLTFRDTFNGIDVMRTYRGGGVGILDGDLDMNSQGGINNIGNSDVDMQYDSGESRFEMRSGGNVDICIGNC